MKISRILLVPCLLSMVFLVSGCPDDYDTSTPSSSGSSGSGSGSSSGTNRDALDGPLTDYTFSCSMSGPYTIQVTDGVCKSQQEYYARVFTCNDVGRMGDACERFYGCLVRNSSGPVVETYQRNYDVCDRY